MPLNSIAYYTAMQRVMGDATVSRFARLFLFPGGGHCNGGDGPFDFALLAALMSWTERGVAPDMLVASHSAGGARGGRGGGMPAPVDRVRPVFAHPMVAAYRGSGDIDDAASFESKPGPKVDPARLDWMGARFYSAGYEQWCAWDGAGLACSAERK